MAGGLRSGGAIRTNRQGVRRVRLVTVLGATLLGVTRHAARALGMADTHGSVELGKAADLCLWNVDHPAELSYAIAASPLRARLHRGVQHPLQ